MSNPTVLAAAEGMPMIGTHDIETALANAISLIGLAVDVAMEHMTVKPDDTGKDEYRTPFAQGNQLVALLIAIRDAGEQTLAIRDAASDARRAGR